MVAMQSTMDKLFEMRMTTMARAYRELGDAPGTTETDFDELLAMIVEARNTRGSLVVLVGPNAAGKTNLVKNHLKDKCEQGTEKISCKHAETSLMAVEWEWRRGTFLQLNSIAPRKQPHFRGATLKPV